MPAVSGAFAFELPIGNAEVAARLIGAVPPDWSWVDGQLDAPLDLVAEGLVARAGYVIDRFDGFNITTLGEAIQRSERRRFSEEERTAHVMERREAKLELITEPLAPAFVKFRTAGFDGQYSDFPFLSVLKIGAAYARRGYLGDLFFYSDCYDDIGSRNPESCSLHLAPYSATWYSDEDRPPVVPMTQMVEELREALQQGGRRRYREVLDYYRPPKQQYPPLIQFEWEGKYGGNEERLTPLLEACTELGLQPLPDPEKIEYGTSYLEYED